MNKAILFSLISVGFFFGCKEKSRWNVPLEEQNPTVEFVDFYQDFYNADVPLEEIKKKYSIFFSTPEVDSIAKEQDVSTTNLRTDSLNLVLYQKTKEIFSNKTELKKELESIFKRLNYHYPELNKFKVYFSVGLFEHYTQPVLYDIHGGNLFIALDLFLGDDVEAYNAFQIPAYYQQNLTPKHLYAAVAQEIAEQLVTYTPRQQNFLEQMIYQGKRMVVVDALLPNTSDEIKIGYTKQQLDWCKENEAQIWNYFVENDLLYSNSKQVNIHFLQPSPYSKFGTESEQDSPGRTGIWVGWQLCKKYLNQEPELTLKAFCKDTDYQKIFTESKYKPL